MHTTAIRSSYATCMLPLVLVLPPPRCLCRRLLLPPLLLEQIVLQPQRTELPTIPLMLPIAATSADAPHCYSAWLAAAAAPDAANVAAEPVHATPRSALSSPPASADATRSCPQLLCLLMHNTATRSSSPRLLRLSQRMLQLNLSALHHLPQCLLPLHPLMLRNDVSIRGSELLSSARDLNGSALRALCVKRIPLDSESRPPPPPTTTTTSSSFGVARVAC